MKDWSDWASSQSTIPFQKSSLWNLLFPFSHILTILQTHCRLASVSSLYWNWLLIIQEVCSRQNQQSLIIHTLFDPSETLENHDYYLLEIFFSLVLLCDYSSITMLAFSPSWTPKMCSHGLLYSLLALNSQQLEQWLVRSRHSIQICQNF